MSTVALATVLSLEDSSLLLNVFGDKFNEQFR